MSATENGINRSEAIVQKDIIKYSEILKKLLILVSITYLLINPEDPKDIVVDPVETSIQAYIISKEEMDRLEERSKYIDSTAKITYM